MRSIPPAWTVATPLSEKSRSARLNTCVSVSGYDDISPCMELLLPRSSSSLSRIRCHRDPVRLFVLCLALAVAGCGATSPPTRTPAPTPEPRGQIAERLPSKTSYWQALLEQRQAAERARLRALAEARRSPTVEASLRAARLSGRITENVETRMRKNWARANQVLNGLGGIRRTELGYVVGSVRALAAAHQLTADRLDPVFLVLNANVRFWPASALPAPGWRTSFGRDPVIFQYYPGHGLQFQPLASWGRANAIAGACLGALRSRTGKDSCRTASMTRWLDRLSSLGARRAGYIAWEYYFAYGSGYPPWVSGMTQATAVQALSRGYRARGPWRGRGGGGGGGGAGPPRRGGGVCWTGPRRAAWPSAPTAASTTSCT